MRSLRKLRAILVIAVTWSLFWIIGGFVMTAAMLLYLRLRWGKIPGLPLEAWATALMMFGAIGAVLGTVFATGLAWAGRRQNWAFTSRRAATLGAFGGVGCYLSWFLGVELLLGQAFPPALGSAAIYGALGALTGIITYATAARGRLPAPPGEAARLPGP